jgi:hypothetical protein
VIIYTNFSPNYFFQNNGINVNDYQIQPLPNWRVQQYSFSAALYHYICKKYQILKIFFITSAPKRVVNDIDFGNITYGVPTTITRKYSLKQSGAEYDVALLQYITEMSYQTICNTYSTLAYSKLLVQHPVVEFCRN